MRKKEFAVGKRHFNARKLDLNLTSSKPEARFKKGLENSN